MNKELKEKYRISVVIPAYNAEKSIERVIKAITVQTYYDLIHEIIVINDGSKDGTERIVSNIAKRDPKVKLINQSNQGVSAARNKGMRLASGNWIALDDSDDIWCKQKIEVEINFLNKNNQIDFIGSAWNKRGVRIFGKKITCPTRLTVKNMCITMHPQTSTVLFTKAIFDNLGGFNRNMQYGEDGEYFLRICSKYNCWYLPNQLIYYGDGKAGFGEKGLSGNLAEMYKGSVSNLKDVRKRNEITELDFILLKVYYLIKHIRRIIIVQIKKDKNERK